MRYEFLRALGAFALAVSVAGEQVQRAGAMAGELEQSARAPSGDWRANGEKEGVIRLNFKGATFTQVVDFFSRAIGLPVVWETPAPEGTLDFLSPERYDREEALEVLNIILQSRGVMLRVEQDMLYLQKLTDMQRENIPTYTGQVPDEVTNDQIVTVVRPLEIALAKPLAERLSAMVASYGSVAAMEQQNALVITETAAQVRRLLGIVEELDRADPEGMIEIIAIKHVKAQELMKALTVLLSQRVEKYVINHEGKQVKIEENAMPGLSLSPDDRTNSIIAKGTQSKIDQLKQTIALLDVESTSQSRVMRTVVLASLSPAEAVERLNVLFQKLPEAQRPVVMGVERMQGVVMVGDEREIAEGEALLREIDRGGANSGSSDEAQTVRVVQLAQARAEAMMGAIASLMDARQKLAVTMIAGLDGRSLVVSGSGEDVQRIAELVPVLDRQAKSDKVCRFVRIENGDVREIADGVARVYGEQADAGDPASAVTAHVDEEGRSLMLVGNARAVEEYTRVLRMVETMVHVERETRRYELKAATPSQLGAALAQLSRPMLETLEGGYTEPGFVPLDQLNELLVIATPEQLTVLEPFIQSLDRAEGAGSPALRVLQLKLADAGSVANALVQQYSQRSEAEKRMKPVSISAEPQTNTLLIAAHPDMFEQIQGIISELNRTEKVDYEGREIRIYPLKVARAAELARTLDEMFPAPPPPLDARGRPQQQLAKPKDVIVRADVQTNSLIVDATVQRLAGFEKLVEQLDRQQLSQDTVVRIYPVLHADLNALTNTLGQLASAGAMTGSVAEGTGRISISSDPVSRTVIIAGPAEMFERVGELMKQLDVQRNGIEMAFQIFALRNVQADLVVNMVREVVMTHMAEHPPAGAGDVHRLLSVTGDARSNALIVSAPTDVMPMIGQIVEQVDRSRMSDAGTVDTKIFQLKQASANDVAAAVRSMLEARSAQQPGAARATVTAEVSSNCVLVTGTPEQLSAVEAVITPLDKGISLDQPQIRSVLLKHARAETVAPLLQQLLVNEQASLLMRPDVLARSRAVAPSAPPVRIAADPGLNAVLIAAPPSILNVAEQMVMQLDVDPASLPRSGQPSIHVLVVEHADVRTLASSVQQLFDEGTTTSAKPVVRVDEASNSLLIRATDEQFGAIAQVVEQVDRASVGASRQMRLVPIDPSKGTAEDVARALERMLKSGGPAGVEVISLEDLLERAKDEQEMPHDAEQPAATQPDAIKSSMRAFPAGVVVCAIACAADEGTPEARVGLSGVQIAVDKASNSLVIMGPQRAVEQVARLAEQLLTQMPMEPAGIHVITLPAGTDAQGLANSVNQLLTGLRSAMGPPGANRLKVMVVADQQANTLLVTAGDSDFRVLAEVLAAITKAQKADEVVMKVYPLTIVPADRAAAGIRGLIGGNQGVGRGMQAQRMRDATVKLLAPGQTLEGVFNPATVRVASDPATNSVLVWGSADAIEFVDKYIQWIDQSHAAAPTFRMYRLEHAKADHLAATLGEVFRARARTQAPAGGIEPAFSADARTNTLLVTATAEKLREIDGMLQELDVKLEQEGHSLRIVELKNAHPSRTAELLRQTVIGAQSGRQGSTLVLADDSSGVLLIRADVQTNKNIDELLAHIDKDSTKDLPIRALTLKHANATAVADATRTFFDDRARILGAGRNRTERSRQVSIIGVEATNTVLVAANEAEFEQVQALVVQLDTPEASGTLSFRVFELKNARAEQVMQTIQGLVNDLLYNQEDAFSYWQPWPAQQSGKKNRVAIRADSRLNALIVTGQGDKFEVVARMIEILDAPEAAESGRSVRVFRLANAKAAVVGDVVLEAFNQHRRRRSWEAPDPTLVAVRRDDASNVLIVSAMAGEQEAIAEMIRNLDQQMVAQAAQTQVLPLKYAQATDLAESLRKFLETRARSTGRATASVIVPSQSANALVVSATTEEVETVRDLVSQLDLADVTGERVVEVIALRDARPDELARIIKEQFGRGTGQNVVVTPDVRTASLIVNAPKEQFAQVRAMIDQLDAPSSADETVIRTYALKAAQAADVVRVLQQTLQLDASGQTTGMAIKIEGSDGAPVQVKARVVADRRSNSVLVTGTPESMPVIDALIGELEQVPPVSTMQWRIVKLEHAQASEVSWTLNQVARSFEADGQPRPRIDYNTKDNQLIVAATADQFEQISKLLKEIDAPSQHARSTSFVPLKFAKAEKVQEALSLFYGPYGVEADTSAKRNVRIIADPATNSLVISADEQEWPGVRKLLAELDNEQYDESLQLRVLALAYADAASVARAINEAFEAGTQQRDRQVSRPQPQEDSVSRDRAQGQAPTVLIKPEDWVRASAEPQTNSVVVSASRQNILKIQEILKQLDVADFDKLPAPQMIPVINGDAQQLAQAIGQVFQSLQPARDSGRQAARIIGESASNTLIVRAEPAEFTQIKALAEALQQQASSNGLSVNVLKLTSVPASRIAASIREAFAAKAQQSGQPLAIQVDAQGNSLVIACTAGLFEEIKATVHVLDSLNPSPAQGIFIIELHNIAPLAAISTIQAMGLDQPQPADSVARIVSEPIRASVLPGRNAIVVLAAGTDREIVASLLKSLDAQPELATAQMQVFKLKNAKAPSIAALLEQVLDPANQQAQTPMARAVREQVRRLSVQTSTHGQPGLTLDMTRPIRVIPNPEMNALVVSSSSENLAVLGYLIAMFDQLPITDAVTVQLFPLQNISAEQFTRILKDLFAQGKELGKTPLTKVSGVPDSLVGAALLEELLVSADDRSNTVVVAGTENAIALVEVLAKRLDSETVIGWLEPRIVTLKYADAEEMAALLQSVLVDGGTTLPQASPLQKQIGRIRLARNRHDGVSIVESEIFQPMTKLIIRPEPHLNALVLIATPDNLDLITELVVMLDVEAASPGASVRIYPVLHGSASHIAQTLRSLFDQQVAAKSLRPEDRAIIAADERTNALIVTTSTRSFTILEQMLTALDADVPPTFSEIRTLTLQNASAARLSRLIQQLMDARLERLRKVQPETADSERVVIVSDERTNSLVVAAGQSSFEIVQKLVSEMDVSTLTDSTGVQVIPLVKANVERIAAVVNQIMARRYAGLAPEAQAQQMPLVLTDVRSNSLLVTANPEDLAAIHDLAAKIDASPLNPAIGLHVIPLAATSRTELLAPRIARLMEDRQRSLGVAGSSTDLVSVEPDSASNSLLVAASEENLEIIRGFIDVLTATEADASRGKETEIITLKASRAIEMIDLLNQLYVAQVNRTRGPDTVRISADQRLNAVVVHAPAADVSAIRDLVAQLDGAKPASVVEIKYITLNSANALETVSLIENVLSGRGIGAGRSSRQATVLKYLRQIARARKGDAPLEAIVDDATADDDQQVEMEVSAAIRESITLTPDLRTNTIIVSAPRDSMSMIERMIRDLDESSTGSRNIRIYKLVNADAVAMAELLRSLFLQRQANNLFVLKPREDGSPVMVPTPAVADPVLSPADTDSISLEADAPAGLSGTELTAVPDERQQLSITVDNRTNSLIVSGTPSYLDLVERVVSELDSLEANEREIYVYQLRNAAAADVARVISDFVDQEQQKVIATLGADQIGSAARFLEREVTIQGDDKSNTVLVSASPRYLDRVKDMISQLDVDPPQVLIQVLLAEVTLDTKDDWGVDLTIRADINGAKASGGFGLASAFVTGMGVPNVAIASTDFDLLIRAMKAQGRLQVLSNPSVMAANNEKARIQVGETIRVPVTQSLSDAGRISSSLIEENIGVILEVTPSINPDGFVRMDINPEISALSDRTTRISEDFESPIITRRTADTTVTVYDGQTIVLGGLISDRYEKRERKVPLLGDVPFIGPLFRSETEQTAKTELLIVLTPHVVDSPAEFHRVDEITSIEVDRLSVPDAVKESIRRSVIEGTGGLYDAQGRPIQIKEPKVATPLQDESPTENH